MLARFLSWLEDSAYDAILRGVRRAVADVSGGSLELEEPKAIEPPRPRRRKGG